MKVVFLDFDGVLNSGEFAASPRNDNPGGLLGLDWKAIARLNRLILLTGAKVVVSSTWRLDDDVPGLRALLGEAGFDGEVIGMTPSLNGPRGLEIQAWLDSAPLFGVDVEQFVIVDDDSDMEHLGDRLVKTTFQDGLQDEHVEKAAALLAAARSALVVPTSDMIVRFS